jgi:hypothetical protein
MVLEQLGIPTACLVTDAFEDLFHLETEQRGMPELTYFLVPHPIGGIRPVRVTEKAALVVAEATDALLGAGHPR